MSLLSITYREILEPAVGEVDRLVPPWLNLPCQTHCDVMVPHTVLSAAFPGQAHTSHQTTILLLKKTLLMFVRSQDCHLGTACPSVMVPSTTVLEFLSSTWQPRTLWWQIWWRTPWPHWCCLNRRESFAGKQGYNFTGTWEAVFGRELEGGSHRCNRTLKCRSMSLPLESVESEVHTDRAGWFGASYLTFVSSVSSSVKWEHRWTLFYIGSVSQ